MHIPTTTYEADRSQSARTSDSLAMTTIITVLAVYRELRSRGAALVAAGGGAEGSHIQDPEVEAVKAPQYQSF